MHTHCGWDPLIPLTTMASLARVLLLGAVAVASAARICDVMSYGASGDGSRYDTDAVRTAIAACTGVEGGATVLFGAGHTFLTGCFNVTSNIRLQVDGRIVGSPNATGYVLVDYLPWYGPDPPQAVSPLSLDAEDDAAVSARTPADTREWQPLIQSWYADNVSIVGSGTIDGSGEAWWRCADSGATSAKPPCSGYPRPHGIRLVGGVGFEVSGITLQNSPMWQLHLAFVTDVHVHDVKIFAPESPASHNTDGIDPDCAQNVLIERVEIRTGDDNIAIKSGRNWYGRTFGRPSRNITVRDSVFGVGHGFSIGSEMSAGVSDVLFANITGDGLATGLRIKSERGRGGLITNVAYRDIRLTNVKGQAIQITMNYDPGLAPTNETATPHLSNVSVVGFTSSGSRQGWLLDGLPESLLQGLEFRDVSIEGVPPAKYIARCDFVGAASCDGVSPSCPPCIKAAARAPALPPPPAQNPFCGFERERNTVTLQLVCVAGVIDNIVREVE